ncbi:MAG: TIGR04086 family membrane protein [Syntrophomonadales bacterium]|jgi:putative membrane protein (TIGR04086 family)
MVRRIAGEFRGLLVALISAVIIGSILAMVVYWTPLRETLLDPLADFTLMLGVFIGGWYSARHYGNRGLLRGMAIGLMFFVFVFLATLIFNPALVSFGSIIKDLALGIVCGGLGGILGVGMSD